MSRQSNKKNDGRSFEELIAATADAYFNQRILRIQKVEPPVRVLYGPPQRVIFLENPFPDFTGSWVERGGRCLMLETKSTTEPKLPMSEKAKLSLNQIEWLKRWHCAGAAVGVLWEWRNNGVVFLPIGQVWEIWQTGRRHIKFEEGQDVENAASIGIPWHFVDNLRHWYPQ